MNTRINYNSSVRFSLVESDDFVRRDINGAYLYCQKGTRFSALTKTNLEIKKVCENA